MPHIMSPAIGLGISLLLVLIVGGCSSDVMLHPGIARLMEASNPTPRIAERDRAKAIRVRNEWGNILEGLLLAQEGDYGTVIVSNGNATSMERTLYYFRFLLGNGFRVLVFSFQGFDANEGKAHLRSLIGDARAFYAYARQAFPGEPIAYAAHSLSTAAALCLTSRQAELAGVVLQGAFDPKGVAYAKLAQLWYLFPLYPLLAPYAIFVSWTVPDELAVKECVGNLRNTPALFVHHPQDTVTPYRGAIELYEAYPGPKSFVVPKEPHPPEYHMNYTSDEAAQGETLRFIRRVLSKAPTSEQAPAIQQDDAPALGAGTP